MSAAWCLYDLAHPAKKLIRRFPAAAVTEALQRLIDHDHPRRFLRLVHEGTRESWERKGGQWHLRAAPTEAREPYWIEK